MRGGNIDDSERVTDRPTRRGSDYGGPLSVSGVTNSSTNDVCFQENRRRHFTLVSSAGSLLVNPKPDLYETGQNYASKTRQRFGMIERCSRGLFYHTATILFTNSNMRNRRERRETSMNFVTRSRGSKLFIHNHANAARSCFD